MRECPWSALRPYWLWAWRHSGASAPPAATVSVRGPRGTCPQGFVRHGGGTCLLTLCVKVQIEGQLKLTCLLSIDTPDSSTHQFPRLPPTSPITDPSSSRHQTLDTESPRLPARLMARPSGHRVPQGAAASAKPVPPQGECFGTRGTEQKRQGTPRPAATERSCAEGVFAKPEVRMVAPSPGGHRGSVSKPPRHRRGRERPGDRTHGDPNSSRRPAVVDCSRPRQNAKSEPLSAWTAGNEGPGRPPPALPKPSVRPAGARALWVREREREGLRVALRKASLRVARRHPRRQGAAQQRSSPPRWLGNEATEPWRRALAPSQGCLSGQCAPGSLGDHFLPHSAEGGHSKVLGTKSMACGLRSSDTSHLVSWLKVSVLEAEPTPPQ